MILAPPPPSDNPLQDRWLHLLYRRVTDIVPVYALFGAGTVSLPAITLNGDTDSGLYQIGANNLGFAVSGAKVLDISSTGLAVTGALSSTGDYKIAGTGIYNAIATNTSLGLFADTNAYAGIKAYGSSHATKANVTELLAGTGVVVGSFSDTGLAVTGKLNTATTTALSWGADTTAGHTLGTQGTGSSLFINTGGLNTSYASGLAVDGSYSSLVSTVNIRALGTYSGGSYEAKLAFFTSSETTQGQRMLLSSTGLAVTGTLSSTGLFTAPRFAWTGDAIGTQGVVATDSTFNKIISASSAYGISTNNAGGLDIMANQDSQAIRMYAGTANNASPPAIATVSSTGLAVTGAISATTTIKTGGYTVATLPAGTVGMRTYVTDATAPTYNGVLTGGGAVTVPVFYNGTAWVSA